MARRVYFAFHYQRDIWRVNQVRNSNIVEGFDEAGFIDSSLWEDSKKKGDDAIKRLIDNGLKNTTISVVLIAQRFLSVNMLIMRLIKAGKKKTG